LGAATGIDLPEEAAGRLPVVADATPDTARKSRTDALPIAIGQSTTTTTPLQIVRIAAAIANGGKLATPHVAQRIALSPEDEGSNGLFDPSSFGHFDPPRPIVGLEERIVSAIRDGMRQAVADEQGTAHATVDLAAVSIAGKTGTAETGPGKPEHAWFVGYAPADQPRVAFVVVIEHAGNADTAAGPVARHFVERMSQLGYFGRTMR
jgi:penicillin-binding protein 2